MRRVRRGGGEGEMEEEEKMYLKCKSQPRLGIIIFSTF